MSAFIKTTTEDLPEAFARSRQSFGGGALAVLIILPDGSGFRAVPNDDGETVSSERLSSAEMLADVMAVYGVEALKRIH